MMDHTISVIGRAKMFCQATGCRFRIAISANGDNHEQSRLIHDHRFRALVSKLSASGAGSVSIDSEPSISDLGNCSTSVAISAAAADMEAIFSALAGAEGYSIVESRYTNPDMEQDLIRSARRSAFKDAHEAARIYADAAGFDQVKMPIEISEIEMKMESGSDGSMGKAICCSVVAAVTFSC